tara:strand:- start:1587 stop:3008 length:1422 start_codon:yes stop_codon:yes gene_type:complete
VDIRERLNSFYEKSKKKNTQPLKTINFGGISLDLTRNLISREVLVKMKSLLTLSKFSKKRKQLFENKYISHTESQRVSFVSYRNSISYKRDIDKMSKFYLKIKNITTGNHGNITISHIVHIGIGGSILGPKFLSEALEDFKTNLFLTHFVSSGDLHEISDLLKKIDVKKTIFIFVSKSFKTDETMRVKSYIDGYINKNHSEAASYIFKNHYVAITANKQMCKKHNFSEKNIFTFMKTLPGRFSVISPVNLINMFELGIDSYKKIIEGVKSMDSHFYKSSLLNNLPVNLALVNIWNINFLSKYANVIVPYSYRLRSLPDYLQQIEMESNGKSATTNDDTTFNYTSPILFGSLGTECQHSFFQAVHQGTIDIYLDFVYLKKLDTDSKRFLAANVLAQADLLFKGKKTREIHKSLRGGSPSNLIGIDKLSPDRIGKLISMYEHKVFVEGVIWGINSYDQWGVEEAKVQAKKNLTKI